MRKKIVLISALMTLMLNTTWMSAKADSAIDISTVMPFIYQGLSYLPLGGVADLLGAPLHWNATNGSSTINYQGEDLVLTPNSLKGMYAGQPVTLPSRSVVINGVTYVPASVLKKYYNIPVTWDKSRSEIRIQGSDGWRTMKANTSPPWRNGPPPWAPAWGLRGHGTPGHSSDGKIDDNRKTKGNKPTLRRDERDGKFHALDKDTNRDGKVKSNKKSPAKHRYGTPGKSSNNNKNNNKKDN